MLSCLAVGGLRLIGQWQNMVVQIIGLTDKCRDHGTGDVINFTEDIREIFLKMHYGKLVRVF